MSFMICGLIASAQSKSIAREWNEIVLEAIRGDFARPTIHARNLFHISIAMYDSWAIANNTASTYLIGQEIGSFSSELDTKALKSSFSKSEIEEILSHAVYHLILHRYKDSPGYTHTLDLANNLMEKYDYDIRNTSLYYISNSPAAIGNYIAYEIIRYGFLDGANEENGYRNVYYSPVNPPLDLTGNKSFELPYPDRWQPLFFNRFIDQSGNLLPEDTPEFLSPEWGNVEPFALDDSDSKIYDDQGAKYKVYLDPGPPPSIEVDPQAYQWGFSLVNKWSSYLTASDTILWDISPASIGNLGAYPESISEYPSFYSEAGNDNGEGYVQNPITGKPYDPQWIKRGDYGRVLAEFWADGPDSETPPGHWFVILNYVMDGIGDQRKFRGEEDMDAMEYEVKSYFLLGGAMHDAAITAWSIKGWYDYVRPISALRYMASLGQSTDSTMSNYHPHGIPLENGLVEVIRENDLDFPQPENIGKIKFYSWEGHHQIDNPESDQAGVGWILAEDWWPYQRPTFVTPPFAGYVSGHSTFSRAAADVLTYITGSPYFPNGLGEFEAKKNEFLAFEEGPSKDITLQWAAYKDAADQCSLSRIWGGIHPPADDIPGRKIGMAIAAKAIRKSDQLFSKDFHSVEYQSSSVLIYPNPISSGQDIIIESNSLVDRIVIYNMNGQLVFSELINFPYYHRSKPNLPSGIYTVQLSGATFLETKRLVVR